MTYIITLEDFTPPPRYDDEPFTQARIEEAALESGPWTEIDVLPISPVDVDPSTPGSRDFTTENATLVGGWYRIIFLDGDGDATVPSEPIYAGVAEGGIRVMVPRVRRAIDGATASSSAAVSASLNDAQVKDLIADAIAEVLWYVPEWGKVLTVTARENGIPTEYDIIPELTLPEQTVIVTQAALDHYFHFFKEKKTSERIANEAQAWEYQLSAGLLQAQFQALREERDKALDMISAGNSAYVGFASFLAARDAETAARIEPFTVEAAGVGGQQIDWRGF